MKFLTLNTASSTVEVALYNDGVLTAKRDPSFKKASEVLFVYAESLMQESNLQLSNLDFIAVVVGAGSFTGIRIGLAFARTLSQVLHIPVVGVTYQEVLAYNTQSQNSIIAVSDAANGLAYVCTFVDKHAGVHTPVQVIKHADLAEFLAQQNPACVVCADAVMAKVLNGIPNLMALVVTESDTPDALVAASIAAFKRDGAQSYEKIVPLYVRVSQAEENLACK